ncbi:alpha-2-macroglobulin family protein [Massilia antarctica]|uniref:alpha-2-macroglobulin family protein n=1 Tax=Massilia antarctica TaxID=2765360 RepID=UPI0006BB839B|nr:MG2 domain-containing protein [Massilia sp. H27-R4]MCY0916065.1 MG2 domain-containing protein [Massilia sp. H27-R4]CUI08383.1 Large extracellular alpha-helical protein [Janthinobacterium sp. CG23_2]CUU32169.1 Large extracellular alpha-helical protein [Janthinobacterium sp. CG23_2]
MRAPSKRLTLLPLALLALAAQAQTTVEAFAPTGAVKAVRQVTARFSAPMVAFGDARLADPFAIDCLEAGSGRWIDARIWSYDFVRDVPPGVRCSFALKPDLRDLAAQPLAGTTRFAFDTGGPSVRESSPRKGSAVDEQQVFILGLDAPARAASIAAKAWCGVEGINERIGVRVLAGAERDQVLAARKSYVDRYIKDYVKRGGTAPKGKDDLPLALVQCKRSLPADAAVSLVWAAGIEGPGGVASSADQALAFTTRRDFTARFSCDYLTADGPCIPLTPLRLTFSEPIARADADKITLASADGKQYRPTWDSGTAPSAAVSNLHFRGPFAEKSSLQLTLPPGIKDDAGRALVNQGDFPMTIAIDTLPPLLKFPARFGIIEAHTERLLPVTVRNIEAKLTGKLRSAGAMLRIDVQGERQDLDVMAWMKRLAGDSWQVGELSGDELKKSVFAGLKSGKPEPFSLPAPGGGRAFEVIGIPLPKPGFYVVELESPKLGVALFDAKNTNAYVSAAALVTNMAAHFKHGADSSLVWVTSLDKGRPVAKAAVAVRDCSGKLLWQGVADASGVARIDKPLARGVCKGNNSMFISARSGADYTFTLSSWQNGIESWRFNLPFNPAQGTTIVSTVFARTLLRAGETVHMKHFLRRHGSRGIEFDTGSAEARATTVTVAHQGGDGSYELPLRWNAAGTADNEWVIPAGAKLGVYEVKIAGQLAGTFRVEQFRVPTMKALLNGPATPLIGATAFDLDLQVGYLAGGVAGKAPVKLRTLTEEKVISFEGYDDYNLGAGDVREGVQDEAGYDEDTADDGGEGAAKGADIRTRALVLDKAGGARVKVDHLPVGERARDLVAEVSYQDANGETLSTSTRIALWPSSYVVGIKPDDWADSKDSVSFEVVVLGVDGKSAPDAAVDVDLFKRVNYSHRRRLIGGFYAYENSSEITRIGPACQGRTNARGLLRCTVKAPADGNLVLRARAVDGQQRAAVSQRDVWVAGGGEWWYRAGDNDRIDLLPSAKRYEPGQDATFQVRSPFRDATVLITVEREGILDTYVRRLDGKEPAFTIPMLGKYAPNVFVSAMVVRGRVAGVQPTAMVDLGKPSYKLGIAPVRVGWSAHELKVQVSTDKQDYKVRENATVTLKVTRADGSPAPAGSEVALAAVDTGLLELMPNNSWRLLNAMMQERVLQVETSTAQMQVVGKRHFGRKAVPTGGGGGKGSRELFDTLLFWKPRIVLDAKGEARVPVVLNDTLTSFRIVAIASGGSGLFGTGSTEIRSSQDLIVVPGLPSVVRAGDRLRAGFTLRNTTDAALKVDFGASMAADGGAAKALARQSLTLAPGQAQEAGWDVQVPAGASALAWTIDARGAGSADQLRVSQKVLPAVPVRTIQSTLVRLDQPQTLKVQSPPDALPGQGGVRTTFVARLGASLPAVRDYMSAYRYRGVEQDASRAVALRDPALWNTLAASLPSQLDADGLVKYYPTQTQGSDSLTAYLLSVSAEAGLALAPALRERMEGGLRQFIQGRVVRSARTARVDTAVRKLAALEALSRTRPVAPELLESFTIEPNLWPTSAAIDWYLILQRSPALAQRDAKLAQLQQVLRARLNLQGAGLSFSTEKNDNWWWIMASPDINANRLLLAVIDDPAWQGDMARLARGTLGRQQKGRWGSTLANAWGVLALDKFSRKFEPDAVSGSSSARLGNTVKEANWNARGVSVVEHPWGAGQQELVLSHNGSGKPWAIVQSLAAVELKAPLANGYRIVKTITPLEQKVKGVWSRGDSYRVRLDIEAQADMTWVALDDPIPASATILGNGLGRDAQTLPGAERQDLSLQPVFEEHTFDAFRAYYDFVPKGKWSIGYTVRLNNQGRFNLPPTRVEALYSPELAGELPNAPVEVGR